MHLNYPDLVEGIESAGKSMSPNEIKQLDEALKEIISEYMKSTQMKEQGF